MKRVVILTACAVALVLVTAALGRPALLPPSPPLPTSPATIEVSPKTNLTTNSEYDRNPSIVKYGTNYWLFYTKGDNTTTDGVRGVGYNPDNDTYMVYYKIASTIAGLTGATETPLALTRPTNFDQRVVTAVVLGSDIYAIVSSGQSGTDRGMYYYKYSSSSWSGPTTLIADTTSRGGHVNAVSDGSTIYIVWECSDATSDFYTYDTTSGLSAKVDISTDNQPKITLIGSTLYAVSIEDTSGDIKVYSSGKTSISWSSHSTAIAGAGFYDPCIVGDGTDLYVVSAPWDSGNDQQCLIQTKYSGGSWATTKKVSLGGYGGTYWWDYWPCGYLDGTDLYVFFTTETDSPTYSDGEIAVVKMDWDLANDHYFYIQNAIDQTVAGDTVNVAPGTYVEYTGAPSAGVAVQIPWFADGAGGLTIQSSDGPASTIIDCGEAGWGVQMVSNQITFTGFTVKNAWSVMNQVSGKGHNLSNLVITDFVNYGLGIYAGDNCTFSNITIHTNDVSKSENRTVKGIDMQEYGSGGNSNNTFQDITIYDIETTGDYGTTFGISWEGDNPDVHPSTGNTFTNVTIHDLTAANWMACGIHVKGQGPGTAPYAIETTCFCGGSIYNIGGDAAATRGFYVDGGCNDLRISGFEITGCDKGVYFSHHSNQACVNVDIHWNRIVGNTEYGVQDYDGDNDVDATNNWWGTLEGGLISGMVSANVDYDPWLWTSQIHLAWGGARLVALQNTDGGWDWPLDDGNPATGSAANTIGPIGKGLAMAYRATGDTTMYDPGTDTGALKKVSTFLLAKTNTFAGQDGYLAAELDDIMGVTTHVAHLNTWFYGKLAPGGGGYQRGGTGPLYSTATYVQLIRDTRATQGIPNLAAWDLGMGLVAAASCGVTGSELDIWIQGVKAEIDELDPDTGYDPIGLAGAIYGLAFVGESYTAGGGGWCDGKNLNQLADLLVTLQITETGGFAWDYLHVIPYDANECIQYTGYAILALNEVGGYRDEIADAVNYMESVQLCTGGWKTYLTSASENNEVTAEAMWGLALSNLLELNVTPATLYVQPGDPVTIHVDVANLLQKVIGYQAIANFSSSAFLSGGTDVTVIAAGGVWDDLIYNVWDVDGDLDIAVGIQYDQLATGTEADATTAIITLTADPAIVTDVTTKVVFRADVGDLESTWMTDMSAQAVSPNKVDSQTVVIDATDPDVTVTYPDGGENLKGGSVETITWTATDDYIDYDSVVLEYSTNSGVSWNPIASNEDNDGSYDWTVPSLDVSTARVQVTVSDLAGNSGNDMSNSDFTIDSTNPVVDNIVAKQGGGSNLTPSDPNNPALQGTVEVSVYVSDDDIGGGVDSGIDWTVLPTITVEDSLNAPLAATAVTADQANGRFLVYVTVAVGTANGVADISVSGVKDKAGNEATATLDDTFYINKNQITATVEMDTFLSTPYNFNRDVVFKATNASNVVLKTWTVTLTFTNDTVTEIASSGTYTLTDVPNTTANLSAKTAWALRRRLESLSFTDGQATADFTGGNDLLGGDINGTNGVNILDYAVLKLNWLTSHAVADINGNGQVGITDYSIMKSNWFTAGDAE